MRVTTGEERYNEEVNALTLFNTRKKNVFKKDLHVA